MRRRTGIGIFSSISGVNTHMTLAGEKLSYQQNDWISWNGLGNKVLPSVDLAMEGSPADSRSRFAPALPDRHAAQEVSGASLCVCHRDQPEPLSAPQKILRVLKAHRE